MKAIILAAGEGGRMGDSTEDLPKLFLEIGGKEIYKHQITHLQSYCDRIVIALGHGFEEDRDPRDVFDINGYDVEIDFIVLEEWDSYENGYTAMKALQNTKDNDVILVCGDVIFNEETIELMINEYHNRLKKEGFNAVGVIEGIQNDMTAVRWNEQEVITDYGKIKGHQEIGVFILNSEYVDESVEVLSDHSDHWFPIIFEETPSKPIFIKDHTRHEINTPSHLEEAKEKGKECTQINQVAIMSNKAILYSTLTNRIK